MAQIITMTDRDNALRITSAIEDVTPALAAHYLGVNNTNRPMSKNHVAFLAQQMEQGQWVFNGESIKFNINGGLIDGQHRLAAIVRSGLTIKMMVIRNIDAHAAFMTLDTGRTRGASDVLSLRGEKRSFVLGSVCRMMYYFEQDPTLINVNRRVSNSDIVGVLNRHPNLRDYLRESDYFMHLMVPRLTIFWRYVFAVADRHKAADMYEKLYTGANMGIGDPMLVLRNRLLNLRHHIGHTRNSIRMLSGLLINAWNAYYQNMPVRYIDYNPTNEDTPRVMGLRHLEDGRIDPAQVASLPPTDIARVHRPQGGF